RHLHDGHYNSLEQKEINYSTGTFFYPAKKDDARQRQLYSVKLDGGDITRISREEGTHDVTFSEDATHYVDDFSALMVPPRLSLCDLNPTCKTFWSSRDLASFNLINPQF